MSTPSRVVLVDGRRVTVFTDRGPLSSRRVYSEELGGYISRQLPLARERAGLSPREYADLRAGSRYQHNAEVYSRARDLTRDQALRDADFRAAAIDAYAARRDKDFDGLMQALADMGYGISDDDRERYRAEFGG